LKMKSLIVRSYTGTHIVCTYWHLMALFVWLSFTFQLSAAPLGI